MVKQTRIIFEVGDVVNLRIRCNTCKREIVQKISAEREIQVACPLCNTPWKSTGSGATATERLFIALHDVLAQDSVPLTILMELDDTENSD